MATEYLRDVFGHPRDNFSRHELYFSKYDDVPLPEAALAQRAVNDLIKRCRLQSSLASVIDFDFGVSTRYQMGLQQHAPPDLCLDIKILVSSRSWIDYKTDITEALQDFQFSFGQLRITCSFFTRGASSCFPMKSPYGVELQQSHIEKKEWQRVDQLMRPPSILEPYLTQLRRQGIMRPVVGRRLNERGWFLNLWNEEHYIFAKMLF